MDCMNQEKLINSFMNLSVHILKLVIDGKEEQVDIHEMEGYKVCKSQLDEILTPAECTTLKYYLNLASSFILSRSILPGAQSYPHRNFSEVVALLDGYFGKLNVGTKDGMSTLLLLLTKLQFAINPSTHWRVA